MILEYVLLLSKDMSIVDALLFKLNIHAVHNS